MRTKPLHRWLRTIASLVLAPFAWAQTAGQENFGFTSAIHPSTPDSYFLSWWGESGYTYFLQHSTNLTQWINLNVMETGADAVVGIGFASTGATDFWRLSWTDQTSVDPVNADFDNDGLTNGDELTTTHTDPLQLDTDRDGLSDGWEVTYGFNPLVPADSEDLGSDDDEDGLSLLQEGQNGTDPEDDDTDGDGMKDNWEVAYGLNPLSSSDASTDADNDGVTNLQEYTNGTDPNDIFNGDLLMTAENRGRPGPDGELVIVVRKINGTPWINAPVTFSVENGDRRISATLGGPTYLETIVVQTDSNGKARVYLEPLTP